MTGLNHAVTGSLVAVVVRQPAIALPAALLSHFAIDMIPHWNYRTPDGLLVKRIAMVLDLLFSVIVAGIMAFVLDRSAWLIILASGLAILPDAMWLPAMLYGRPTKPDSTALGRLRAFHQKIQWSETTPGILVEALWFMLIAWLVFRLGR